MVAPWLFASLVRFSPAAMAPGRRRPVVPEYVYIVAWRPRRCKRAGSTAPALVVPPGNGLVRAADTPQVRRTAAAAVGRPEAGRQVRGTAGQRLIHGALIVRVARGRDNRCDSTGGLREQVVNVPVLAPRAAHVPQHPRPQAARGPAGVARISQMVSRANSNRACAGSAHARIGERDTRKRCDGRDD